MAKVGVPLAPPHHKVTLVTKINLIKMMFLLFFRRRSESPRTPLSSRTHPSQDLSRYIPAIVWEGFAGGCRPRQGGWGSNEDDTDPRGDDNVDDLRLCRPHTTINLSDKEKGGLGGAATVDANLRGRVGDAANEEKIQTTAMEKEKEWVRARARATRWIAAAGGGMGSKTTTTEAVVEATAVAVRVDTGAATTATTATMVTATAMTQLPGGIPRYSDGYPEF